jgi:hypothetical protein
VLFSNKTILIVANKQTNKQTNNKVCIIKFTVQRKTKTRTRTRTRTRARKINKQTKNERKKEIHLMIVSIVRGA